MSFVQAKCPSCGGILSIDNTMDAAVCEFCGLPFVLEKAINNYNTAFNSNRYTVNNFGVGAKVTMTDNSINISATTQRMFMFLEDRDFISADKYAERILDAEPENVQAYIGKLLSELKLCSFDELRTVHIFSRIKDNPNYKRIMQFGDENIKTEFARIEKESEKTVENELLKQIREIKRNSAVILAKAHYNPAIAEEEIKIEELNRKHRKLIQESEESLKGRISRAFVGAALVDELKSHEKKLAELKKTADAISFPDTISLGSLNNRAMKWRILEICDNRVLLIAEDDVYSTITAKSYCNREICDYRKWLNRDFLEGFLPCEKARIITTDVGKKEYEGTINYTKDKVFILSCEELNRYFINAAERAAFSSLCLRPAMWINID